MIPFILDLTRVDTSAKKKSLNNVWLLLVAQLISKYSCTIKKSDNNLSVTFQSISCEIKP